MNREIFYQKQIKNIEDTINWIKDKIDECYIKDKTKLIPYYESVLYRVQKELEEYKNKLQALER